MSAIMVCSEDSSEKERGWTIIATKILCLSLIGVIHFQGRFWDIKLQINCLTLSWIRSMHLNFQKVCNFLLQFRLIVLGSFLLKVYKSLIQTYKSSFLCTFCTVLVVQYKWWNVNTVFGKIYILTVQVEENLCQAK